MKMKILLVTLLVTTLATLIGVSVSTVQGQGGTTSTPAATGEATAEATNEATAEATATRTATEGSTATPTLTLTATDTPTPTITPLAGEGVSLTFRALGLEDRILRGPFDQTSYAFALPADWQPLAGTRFELDLVGFNTITSAGTPLPNITPSAIETTTGLIEIFFNDQLVETFSINWNIDTTLSFEIPADALTPVRSDGRHSLTLQLDTGYECNSPSSGLTVSDDSLVQLRYERIAPSTDLRLLPRPFYQRSYLPDSALVVVPTNATPSELTAALRVAAGLGRGTFGNLALTLITLDQLTPELQAANHLILVGKTDTLPLLAEITLDSPDMELIQPTDGVLWMAVSPWNDAKVVLAVTSATDEGMLKAGQAASSQEIRTSSTPNLAIVSDTQAVIANNAPGVIFNQSFAQAGHPTTTIRDLGVNDFNVDFVIPPNQDIGSDAFAEITFNHSTLMDYTRSGVTISLNDSPIGSIRLTDDNATLTTLRFGMPATLLKAGVNRLTVTVELRPLAECYDPDTLAAWFTIHDNSNLNLLLGDATTLVRPAPSLNLASYPRPFSDDVHLNDVRFILPPDDPQAWHSALQIAYDLGNQTDGAWFELESQFTDAELPVNEHLIFVGRPSQQPILAAWESYLPAAFAPESDTAIERDTAIFFREPLDGSVGYVELIQHPTDPARMALFVLGTDSASVAEAGSILSSPNLRRDLLGNLAVIDGTQVIARNVSSIVPTPINVVALPTSVAGIELSPEEEAITPDTYDWIPQFIIISSALTLAILAFVFVTGAVRAVRPRPITERAKLMLDLPFPVEFIDYRQQTNIQSVLDNIRATDPRAVVWAEGFPTGKSPGLTRNELSTAESLVVLTAPATHDEFEDVLKFVHPARVYMVADLPPINQLTEFIKGLRRLTEVVVTRADGRVELDLMTERLAQPEQVVRLGLEYLEAIGVIEVDFNDDVLAIKAGDNKPDDRKARIAMKRLQDGWEDVVEYRRYLRRVALP